MYIHAVFIKCTAAFLEKYTYVLVLELKVCAILVTLIKLMIYLYYNVARTFRSSAPPPSKWHKVVIAQIQGFVNSSLQFHRDKPCKLKKKHIFFGCLLSVSCSFESICKKNVSQNFFDKYCSLPPGSGSGSVLGFWSDPDRIR